MAAPEPITQDRIYRALKAELSSGRLAPGRHLEAPALARRHGVSITPVREALYRLVGEDRIRLQEGGGFSVPLPGQVTIAALYDCNLRLLLACLRPRGPMDGKEERQAGTVSGEGLSYRARTERLFARIADEARNPELAALIARLSDRLAVLRLAEPEVLPRVHEELAMLETLAGAGEQTAVRIALRRYHRRRQHRGAALRAALMTLGAATGN